MEQTKLGCEWCNGTGQDIMHCQGCVVIEDPDSHFCPCRYCGPVKCEVCGKEKNRNQCRDVGCCSHEKWVCNECDWEA